MTGRTRRRCGGGEAAAEYLAIVLVVVVMFAGLLVLRDHRAGRRAPVNPIPAIVRLLGTPLDPPHWPRAHRPAPRRPSVRRPPPPRPGGTVVRLPEWWR